MIKSMLKILPLTPLSLVTSTPGSFFRSANEPSHEMIYGMLENIMGWHYSTEIRKSYSKLLKKAAQKNKSRFQELKSGSGFAPVIQRYVHINRLFVKPHTTPYIDMWTQHLKHNDKRHFDGVRNYDHRFTREVNTASDKEKEVILKQNGNHFPNYYQSPKKREFVRVFGEYVYEVEIDEDFLNVLQEKINDPIASPYLGTSEGWVDVTFEILNKEV